MAAADRLPFGGRYTVRDVLEANEGTERLLAWDSQEGMEVVVESAELGALPPAMLLRLQSEATRLRHLRGRCLAPVCDVGSEEHRLYLVLPRVPHGTLADRLRAIGHLPLSEALAVGWCVLSALSDLHHHGVIHTAIRPDHVFVGTARDGGAVLGGFGLARVAQLVGSASDEPMAVLRYLSPEQAGLTTREVDERSDLYSTGLLLFESLSGRPAFVADSARELLRQHLSSRPPHIRALGVGVPRIVDEFVQRLLRKDPSDRYQSAAAALDDLEAIGAALERGEAEPTIALGSSDRRTSLTQPVLVGREDELGALESHVGRAKLGGGGLVLLEGRSGDGKTRLLDELALRSVVGGLRIFRGQALDRIGQRPFSPLAGVMRDLASAVIHDSGAAERLRTRLGDQLDAACRALPELAEVLRPAAPPASGPEAHGEVRSVTALTSLLDALGTRDRPALVLLDDCQSADELTIRLLARWHTSGLGRRRYVTVVAAFRSGEEGHRRLLPALPREAQIDLRPLDADHVRRLVESMAGPVPDAVPGVVVSLAQGNPFMASAILRGLVESGVLVPGTAAWTFDPTKLGQVQSSRQAADLFAAQVELLPPPALILLSTGAVLGREFDIEFAGRLAGIPLPEAVDAIGEAQRRHIVWGTGGASRATFVHDRLRETFLARMSDEERRRLHGQVALALQADGSVGSFDLAYHFDAAGEQGLAVPHALAAAEQARSQYALGVAEEYYRVAVRGAPEREPDVRRRATEGLGEILMLRGTYPEAASHLEEALRLAADPAEQARLDGRLGELAFKQNDAAGATQRLRRALRRLGQPVPHLPMLCLALAAKEVAVFAAGQVLASRLPAPRPKNLGTSDLLAGHLYGRLTYASWVQGRILPCVFATFRHVNLARRYEPTPTLGQAWSDLGVMVSVASPWWWRRGAAFLERSLAVRRALGDAWGEGQALHFYGVVLHAGGQYPLAIDRCEAAVPLLERTGDRWELNSARWHKALCHYRLGQLDAATYEAEQVRRDGLEIGDEAAAGIAVEILARASEGRVSAQLVGPMLERISHRPGDTQTGVAVLLAEAIRLLHDGRHAEAMTFLEQACALADKARSVYGSPAYPWLATAARLAAAGESPYAPRQRRAATDRAGRAARRSLRRARIFRNDLPHAMREAGLLAAMRGRPRRARRLLDQSLAASERQGARYEYALTRKTKGEVGLALGWEGAESELLDAQAALEEMAPDVAGDKKVGLDWLSLTDRLDALLEAGRRITSVESSGGLATALHEAALTTLRAEGCVVIEVPESSQLDKAVVAAGEHDDVIWSQAIVEQAIRTRRPVVFAEGDPLPSSADPADTATLAGVRSVLCAPVTVGDRVATCVYAVHRQIAGLFGQDESDLAEFIASLAGAAGERELLQRDTLARVIDAQEAERARVARDLHDEIGQALTSVLLGLRLAHESFDQDPQEAARQNARVRELVSDALRRVRGLAFELRPAVLDDLGLSAALRRLVREHVERHGLAIELAVDGLDQERLPAEIDTAVYRVTQEALTNVLRHAGDPGCRVSVVRSGGRLRLTVEDHGRGFDRAALPAESFGLRGMTERASLVGGTLTIDSVPGEGTLVALEVPLP